MITPNGTELDSTKAYPLFCKLFDDLREDTTKISNRVYELLNEEQFNVVLVDNKTFGFETNHFGRLPNYAYSYLIKYIQRHYGLRYVYERLA